MVWPNIAMMGDESPWTKKSILGLIEAMLAGGCQDSPEKMIERANAIEKEIKAHDEKAVQEEQTRRKIEDQKCREAFEEQNRKEVAERKRKEELIAHLVTFDPEVVEARNASLREEQEGKPGTIKKAKARLYRVEEKVRSRIRGTVEQY